MIIKKLELKRLVKACLIEILSEGLGDVIIQASQSTTTQPQHESKKINVQAAQTPQQRAAANIKFAPTIMQDAKKLANGDPVMESIFADTAATHQDFPMDQGSDTPGPQLNVEHFQGDPLEIFGESASHWAQILSKLG
jgi:hypothetical protein